MSACYIAIWMASLTGNSCYPYPRVISQFGVWFEGSSSDTWHLLDGFKCPMPTWNGAGTQNGSGKLSNNAEHAFAFALPEEQELLPALGIN